MNKNAVATKNAPAAIGPYSQGINIGELVFTSGQLGMDPATGNLKEGIEEQAKQALENLKAVLEAGGSSMEKAVKVTVFLQSMDDFAVVNGIYATYFIGTAPARSAVEVAKLPKGGLIEIEAIGLV